MKVHTNHTEEAINVVVRARAEGSPQAALRLIEHPPEIVSRTGALALLAFVLEHQPKNAVARCLHDFIMVRGDAVDAELKTALKDLKRQHYEQALRADKAEHELRTEAANNARLRRENSELKAELQSGGGKR